MNESNTKHTSGPWTTERFPQHGGGAIVTVYAGTKVVHSEGYNAAPPHSLPPNEIEANARLIAAAPELLEALTSMVDAVSGPGHPFPGTVTERRLNEAVSLARAAIAKATGQKAGV